MARRIGTLLVVLTIAWGGLAAATFSGLTPRLGLDLQGGTSVILTAPEGTDLELLRVATDVLRARIEGIGNVQEPEISVSGDRNILIQLPGVTDQEEALAVLGQTGELSFRPVEDARLFGLGASPADYADLGVGLEGLDPVTGLTVQDDPDQPALLAEFDGQDVVGVYRVGPAALLGTDVDEALPGQAGSTISAGWAVNLSLSREGADKFQELTRDAAGAPIGSPQRIIAIVLDGRVVTAPPVSEQVNPAVGISGGQAQITTGNDDEAREEAEDLAVVLRYGSLPVPLERSSLQKVSATLGADSLAAGLAAGVGGLALVALAVVLYYRSLGLVTVIGLTIFGSLLVALFGVFGRVFGLTLTLSGVTGIVVAIGITADSYIVYYERIKEEIRKGATVSTAVTDGFRKAYRTILTADTVSILGAFLLWVLAVGPVKGFALALGLATALDIVVARYYTKNAVAVVAETSLSERGFMSIRAAAGART